MAKRINVLGVGISVTNIGHSIDLIRSWIYSGEKQYICVTGVHGVMESQGDESLRSIHNRSGLTVPDGRPLYWLGRLEGHAEMGPVPGELFSLEVCESAAREGWSIYLYGGAEGVAQDLASTLTARFPGLNVVGAYTPPFRPLNASEETNLVSEVDSLKPDIFWVGLSTPKQERFMAEYLPKLNTKVMMGVGAVFDYHTGRISRTPEPLRRLGLAWLYRLGCEPKRLWRRYVYSNPRFVGGVIAQRTGLKRFPSVS